MTEQLPTTYKANPIVSCRIEAEEDAILFNPDTDNTCILNGTGIAIWQFLGTAQSEDEICKHLADQDDEAQDRESLLPDIRAFLLRLGKGYLIREPDNDT